MHPEQPIRASTDPRTRALGLMGAEGQTGWKQTASSAAHKKEVSFLCLPLRCVAGQPRGHYPTFLFKTGTLAPVTLLFLPSLPHCNSGQGLECLGHLSTYGFSGRPGKLSRAVQVGSVPTRILKVGEYYQVNGILQLW